MLSGSHIQIAVIQTIRDANCVKKLNRRMTKMATKKSDTPIILQIDGRSYVYSIEEFTKAVRDRRHLREELNRIRKRNGETKIEDFEEIGF